MEEAIKNFTKRYLIISTELEEMKKEFIGETCLVNDLITLARKNDKNTRINKSSLIEANQIKKEDKNIVNLVNSKKKTDTKRSVNNSIVSDKGRKEKNISPNLLSNSKTNRNTHKSESKLIKKEVIKNLMNKPKEKKREKSVLHISNLKNNIKAIKNDIRFKYSSEKCSNKLHFDKGKLFKSITILIKSQYLL